MDRTVHPFLLCNQLEHHDGGAEHNEHDTGCAVECFRLSAVGENRRDPRLAERWDLVAWGMELGTAYTELTDQSGMPPIIKCEAAPVSAVNVIMKTLVPTAVLSS